MAKGIPEKNERNSSNYLSIKYGKVYHLILKFFCKVKAEMLQQ